MKLSLLKQAAAALVLLLAGVGAQASVLTAEQSSALEKSACGASINYLIDQYEDPRTGVAKSLHLIAGNFVDPPESYHMVNPWRVNGDGAELLRKMVRYFVDWCEFLPLIQGSNDNGLAYIQGFAWFYYKNPPARDFVQGRNPLDPSKPMETGLKFTTDFSNQRGAYLNSKASRKFIQEWIDDPRIEIDDYQRRKAGDYKNWNDFFARELVIDRKTQTIPSRPVTMPARDYVISAPTDCIMNPLQQVITKDDKPVQRQYLNNPLQYDTVLDVKGIPLSMAELLQGVDADLRDKFVGGSGLACVLMPNTYHRFHAPVSGKVLHAEVIRTGTYGYEDWPNWVQPSGNVAGPGTDFSQFQSFERGVIIMEVTYDGLPGKGKKPKQLTGYVASIPVGLDTIGSVVLSDELKKLPVHAKRGYTEFGYFQYGGSLNILLFSEGLVEPAVQTRMGNQIGIINLGRTPPVIPPMPFE